MGRLVDIGDLKSLFDDGAAVYLGGMTLYRRPLALTRALLASGVGRLTLMPFTAGIESDLLVGAGRVATVRTCYFGLESFGLAPMYTKAAGSGSIAIVEETETTLALGMRAALGHTGFLPARALLGTDMLRVRPDLRMTVCPYTGQTLLAVPELRPTLALIHAPLADDQGNAFLGGNLALDREAALLADRVIVSAEAIVPRDALPRGQIDVPAGVVSAVVLAPRGAWPTSCFPDQGVDGMAILRYIAHAALGSFDAYLDAFLHGEAAVTALATPAGVMPGQAESGTDGGGGGRKP